MIVGIWPKFKFVHVNLKAKRSFFFFIKVCRVFAGGVVCGSNFYIEILEQTFAQSTLE